LIDFNQKEIERTLVNILNGQIETRYTEKQTPESWLRLFHYAERHGIAPLIYWQLRREPTLVPAPVFEQFKQAYLTTLGRNRIFLAELDRVVRLLNAQGIAVVLLKGAVFARTLYEDIGLRPMSDLDILIHKEDIPRAVSLLRQHGYEEPVLHLSEMFKQDVTHDVHLRQVEPPFVNLEVHWLLVGGEKYRHAACMEWFWQRIHPLLDFGEKTYTFTPTAQLLHICAHLGYHHGLGSVSLLWLNDIACCMQKYMLEINWSEFLEGAKMNHWSAAAYYTFREVENRLKRTFPFQVFDSLYSQMTQDEERHVLSMRIAAPGRAIMAWGQWQQLDNISRLRNLISRVFPSLAFMRERYGFRSNWQAILGYPVRWVDLGNVLLKYVWARVRAKHR
jgi:hypothetical protein